MMIPLPNASQYLIGRKKTRQAVNPSARSLMTLFFFFCIASGASAQSVVWTDSFLKGTAPTSTQCDNWSQFLDQLAGKSFVSVTISGSRDQTGKTMSDPDAANRLAALLTSRTPGTVESGGHRWTVSKCLLSACPDALNSYGIALSYDGNISGCDCYDRYAIRPQVRNADWGGLNVDYSCTNSPDQTMRLVFSSGVTISSKGSTILCEGSTVELTADVEICDGQVNYLWNNGATTKTITVSNPGTYSVSVSGEAGCKAKSESVVVTSTDVAVKAGEDVTYSCNDAVQLNAIGTSGSASTLKVNSVCVFNPPSRDCTFNSTVCLEGAVRIGPSSYFTNVNYTNPVKLTYNIYYTAFAPATLRFKLNNKELGYHHETNATGACDTKKEGKFPQSFSFNESEFKQHWIAGGTNELRVEIETSNNGLYLAGITAEVETSNESYSWSPITGLSNASLRNPLAQPTEPTDYIVTYTDANGCSATDVVKVMVNCSVAPVAVAKELEAELEDGCEASVAANAFDGGSTSPTGSTLSFSVSPAGPYPVGVTNVVFTVTDANGKSSTSATKITVKDLIPPVISNIDDVKVLNDGGACSAVVALERPYAFDNCNVESVTHDQEDNVFLVGETFVTWTAKDIHGNTQRAMQRVVVTNDVPVINSVQVSASPVTIGNPVTLTTSITDNNAKSATIDWGDFSAPQQIASPSGIVESVHSFTTAGTFKVTVSIVDECDALATYTYESIVVYDGNGSVRGDGWFESERGFYVSDPRKSGKAKFHFDARYEKGSSTPVGNISFKFKSGNLDFKSTELGWLMVQDDRAMLYGSGKVNRMNNYSILISAVDADVHEGDSWRTFGENKKEKDEIRVKIWDPAGNVIYDTQADEPDDAIASANINGSIEIRQSKFMQFGEQLEDAIASHFGNEAASVYPNPFDDWLNVQYNSGRSEDVLIQLLDLTGKVIVSEVFPVSDDGYYGMDIPDNAREGIYILVIKQGKRVEYLRLLRK